MVNRAAWPLAVAGSLLLAAAAPMHGADVTKETVTSRNKARVYYLYAPASVPPERPAPLIVTIHGSTRNGKTLVDAWKDLAEKEGIVLAGPDSTDAVHWASPQDGPLLLRDVVDAVGAKRAIDPRRVFALQMACLESQYFAAAAVHAGAVDPQYFSVFDYAARKIPIAIWIGTRDEFFPIDGVRATAKALEARGFPVTLTEIPDQNHNYAAVAKDLNVRIWAFLSDQKLPGDSKYRVYADPN
jgi:poly(3-hydroxybutyrate) depolymerase